MYTPSLEQPTPAACDAVTPEVERAMARFPLILEILGQLQDNAVPQPGDEDLRHGCRRALTAMLAVLSRNEPAAAPGPSRVQNMTALEWIHSPAAARLIDADQLQRFEQFISRIPAPCGRHP